MTGATIFTALAVYEIMQSKKIEMVEKLMWVVGLLFINIIVGFVYVTSARNKILNFDTKNKM